MASRGKKAVLLKVLLLGESHVGKTSVFQRYIKGEFSATYKATIGADFFSKDLTVDDKEVILQIWDTAGQERYQSLGVTFFRGSDACILCYDITERSSFEALTNWVQQFLQGVGGAASAKDSAFIFVVVGNKSDLNAERAVDQDEAKAFCEDQGFQFFETSAKTGDNVEEVFKYIATQGIGKSEELNGTYTAGGVDIGPEIDEEVAPAGGCNC